MCSTKSSAENVVNDLEKKKIQVYILSACFAFNTFIHSHSDSKIIFSLFSHIKIKHFDD